MFETWGWAWGGGRGGGVWKAGSEGLEKIKGVWGDWSGVEFNKEC